MTLFLAFLIGFLAGLRSLTPPAAVAWAAHLGWLKLEGIFVTIGALPVVGALTLLALGEFIADKLPWIPRRTALFPLLARVLMGKITGACIAIAAGEWWVYGVICGAIGALAGCFAGYYARMRTVKALGGPDWPIALLEDLVVVAGCLWVVTRF